MFTVIEFYYITLGIIVGKYGAIINPDSGFLETLYIRLKNDISKKRLNCVNGLLLYLSEYLVHIEPNAGQQYYDKLYVTFKEIINNTKETEKCERSTLNTYILSV